MPATARSNPVNGTGETQSSQAANVSSASNNQRDLISNRVKAFLSIGELKIASLVSLNDDPVYGPILHQVPNWLTQKAKSSHKAIKIPAWLRCDACKLFFIQPFCLPCCNSIICKHCMHVLRRELYDSPDYLGRDCRRVPDPTIPCPSCKESLHGTQIDAWNDFMTRLSLQVTVRHNMPGAHELAFHPKEEGSDEEESIAGEDVFEECNVQVCSSEEKNELEMSLRRPNRVEYNSSATKLEVSKTLPPSQISGATMALDSQPQHSELWWRTLPVIKYDTSLTGKPAPVHRKMAKPMRPALIKLNPPKKCTSAEIKLDDPSSKPICTNFTAEISPLYHGVTAGSALGPWKTTPLGLQNSSDSPADENTRLEPDVLSDEHPFIIQNQFRMSTEFAPLWRSYYQHGPEGEGTAHALCEENTGLDLTAKGESGLQEEDEKSLSGLLRDFYSEDLAPDDDRQSEHEDDDADSNTDFFECELANWSKKAENILTTDADSLSPPRKPKGIKSTTPEKQTSKSAHGLLTPPDSASTTRGKLLQEYPSPTQSWESISSIPFSPIPALKLDARQSKVSPFSSTPLNLRIETREKGLLIAPPLGTPTRADHAAHTGQPMSSWPQTDAEAGDYFNLEEQLNDRLIYNRTLDIQLNTLYISPEFRSSSPPSHGRIGRKEIPILSLEDEDGDTPGTFEAMDDAGEEMSGALQFSEQEPGESNKGGLSGRTRVILQAGTKKMAEGKKRGVSGVRPVWKV